MIRLGVLLVFFAGLGHAWLHHAHVGNDGHFSAGIEKACLSEKLVADVSASFVLAPSFFERDCGEPASDHQRRCRLVLAASPRGPPHTS